MINLTKLYSYKESFGYFALQLMYPEKLDFHPAFLEEVFSKDHPGYTHVHQYWTQMQSYSLEGIQEGYAATFDFQKDCALYMTYFKFEDAKERGQMLAKLKLLYEMFGLEMPEGELPDFLPLMCEFLYAAEWLDNPDAPENFRMLIAILEDGTYHLLMALEKNNSPYFHLVKGLRETFKACAEQEALSQ
ncbi:MULTISPECIES: nitrate reductase molybdenum cofactor assembly chaperone [unclassified Paenibacillus]|uniref:nitrate reductase molybdenum cofactor assembly chaperone n=1 Tax=unclassified Paenibacillus TaxID=185978 RepID=UPI0024057F1C|nr:MULTISPECIES: nitrate reductase molybdenum cofactor assembly chaperone [unclassified Paenibacillus]MDF9839321.1 nitrate reductase delta subunit [Paenibacillus sp. PastF-2]MDF9845902.1 nitrate reductase delta subunit [Paenibacillus sp. PastM-2]MDF9852475.1 nitrate reductase delta subunit [Paenibacillus sp. PastF-1]MDH6477795.1 nitrate reductase delta subunit [Paenibacillus sp. PastH-2]MDH6505534.1 nitrate reductase delta subunit [Paenibacillus sp. PastM-3]